MARQESGERPAARSRVESFEALYAAHHRTVLAYCARRASRPDAWDAAAEVFAIAWRRRIDVPRGEEALPWLLGVAYRVIANQRRSAMRRRRLTQRAGGLGDAPPAIPDAQLVRSEEEAEVIAALAGLRQLDREIIQLALWDELPRDEIGRALGLSRTAVDQRLSRAKRRLARELDRITTRSARATADREGNGGRA